MTTTSFWTQEFLRDVVEALDVSLGRVNVEELQSYPGAAERWLEAQAWLKEARSATTEPSSGAAKLPPFPLGGKQLRSLQRAIDQAVQEREKERDGTRSERFMNAASAEPPVTAHGRMLQHLERVLWSSWALAVLLILIFALNAIELLFDAGFWPVFGAGVILSILAITVWWTHHRRISHHARYAAGMRDHFDSPQTAVAD